MPHLVADEARSMLQGVGSRFDFHVCKTLSDLRSVHCTYGTSDRSRYFSDSYGDRTREIFDIIVDYPDSSGALQDLKVCLLLDYPHMKPTIALLGVFSTC